MKIHQIDNCSSDSAESQEVGAKIITNYSSFCTHRWFHDLAPDLLYLTILFSLGNFYPTSQRKVLHISSSNSPNTIFVDVHDAPDETPTCMVVLRLYPGAAPGLY